MTGIIQIVMDALSLGGLYALTALGIGIVFSVMRLANFAHAELVTRAAYALFALSGQPVIMTLAAAVFVYAFAMLVGGLSFLPGGLGSSEAVMIGLLALHGFPEPAAVTATLICRLATLWFAVALGAVFLARQRR